MKLSSAKINVCPASDISYVGTCPILDCPANFSRLSKNTKSGCYFETGRGTDLASIAQSLGKTMPQANADYSAGFRELEKVMELVTLLPEPDTETGCLECGYENCEGGHDCDRRKDLVTKLLGKYPFSIKELGFNKYTLWVVAERSRAAGIESPILPVEITELL